MFGIAEVRKTIKTATFSGHEDDFLDYTKHVLAEHTESMWRPSLTTTTADYIDAVQFVEEELKREYDRQCVILSSAATVIVRHGYIPWDPIRLPEALVIFDAACSVREALLTLHLRPMHLTQPLRKF